MEEYVLPKFGVEIEGEIKDKFIMIIGGCSTFRLLSVVAEPMRCITGNLHTSSDYIFYIKSYYFQALDKLAWKIKS